MPEPAGSLDRATQVRTGSGLETAWEIARWLTLLKESVSDVGAAGPGRHCREQPLDWEEQSGVNSDVPVGRGPVGWLRRESGGAFGAVRRHRSRRDRVNRDGRYRR